MNSHINLLIFFMENYMKSNVKFYELNFSEILFFYDGSEKTYSNIHNDGMKKILIVDDEEIISDMYKIKFKKEGYEVFTARNGTQGLILAHQEKPDIILTDLVMPKYDGFYPLKHIKNDPELKHIPVITLSNLDDSQKRKKACELGAIYYLVKSEFLPKEVVGIIKEILSVGDAHKEALVYCGQN